MSWTTRTRVVLLRSSSIPFYILQYFMAIVITRISTFAIPKKHPLTLVQVVQNKGAVLGGRQNVKDEWLSTLLLSIAFQIEV